MSYLCRLYLLLRLHEIKLGAQQGRCNEQRDMTMLSHGFRELKKALCFLAVETPKATLSPSLSSHGRSGFFISNATKTDAYKRWCRCVLYTMFNGGQRLLILCLPGS